MLPLSNLNYSGHVLVSPKRVVRRFAELTKEEVSDLWLLAQRVGAVIEPHFGAGSLTLAIQAGATHGNVTCSNTIDDGMQDGPLAGQTVPHVHIHLLPRKKGDFERNDEVYDAIDAASKDAVATAG